MSAISEVFESCRRQKRAAFIPYITAGDPDLATTGKLMKALAAGGADIIELGIPFSDPMADGPANQRAASRALAAGTRLSGIFEVIARHRSELGVPIVLFTYFNPIHARGLERFAEQAQSSGVDGVLCLDLPPEEAEAEYLPVMRRRGLDTIFLLAPTSTRQRIQKVTEASTGFVYYVSRTGVTGATGELPKSLLKEAKSLRRRVKMPLAVGFGINTAEQVGAVGKVADGVVVGSELVRLIEAHATNPDLAELLEKRVRELTAPLRK